MPPRTHAETADSPLRRWLHDVAIFARTWLRSPRKTGALVPSSPVLARAIVSHIDPHAAGWVVEIGAGTGAMTQALLDSGVPPSRILVVERNSKLCAVLRQRFPELNILHEDAQRLNEILQREGIEHVYAIISSLPLLSLPDAICHKIISEMSVVMKRGAFLMQFTYRWGSPIPEEDLSDHTLSAERTNIVLRNIPPASVWKFKTA